MQTQSKLLKVVDGLRPFRSHVKYSKELWMLSRGVTAQARSGKMNPSPESGW